MPLTSPVLGRPPDRKELIVRRLRDQIIEGQILPGNQLPTRSEIERIFRASPGTVQNALEHLRRDGFVVVNGRQGTFVADNPPHLTNYALVFPSLPTNGDANWGRFWTALSNEALILGKEQNRKISVYYNINEHRDSEDFSRLMYEVKAHRLAGMIFASSPHLVDKTPIVEEPGIPRVIVGPSSPEYGISSVGLDRSSFWQKAIEYLVSQGRRRIAIVMAPYEAKYQAEVVATLERAGVRPELHWIQGVHLKAPEMARNLTHLLFHPGYQERPDGLIIADDNLVEHTTGGLVAAGMQVPDDVEVVAHCNFPWPAPSVLPVKRLGYDVRQVFQMALQVIDKERRENAVPTSSTIPALFEEEASARYKTHEMLI